VQGRKLVLFITGKCKRNCFYCPLSEKRKGIDAVWANERKLSKKNAVKEAIEEAKINKAKGAGITGGDPLICLNRTCHYIKALKKAFKKTSKNFHIHIYLPTPLVTKSKLLRLAKAGVDEVRFHPSFLQKKTEEKIEEIEKIKLAKELAKKFGWKVGIEIPVLPNKEREILNFIESCLEYLDFINMNELELSDTNLEALKRRGYKEKNKGAYAVKGSEETALKILKALEKKKIKQKVHYCSAATKNLFQYKNRLTLRAKTIAKPYDIITENGTLYRGALYIKGRANIKDKVLKLKKMISSKFFEFDKEKKRILCPVGFVLQHKKKLKEAGFIPTLVEEMPTYDKIILQIDHV